MLAAINKVARQAADGKIGPAKKNQPDSNHRQENAEKHQHFADFSHRSILKAKALACAKALLTGEGARPTFAGLLLLRRCLPVLSAEALDAAGSIDQLLLASKKRVATRANFYVDVAFVRGTRGETVPTRAVHAYFVICGMNSCLH